MDKNTRNILLAVAAIAIALGLFALLRPSSSAINESAARLTVQHFGQQMQKVSLLSPNASSALADAYAKYVTPDLIAYWQSDVSRAPGRVTSSPWPDHIQITDVVPQGEGYVVHGGVVLMTSTGLAGVTPVVLQVVPQPHDGWLIAAYEEQATTTPQS